MPGFPGMPGGDDNNDFMKALNDFAKDLMSGDDGKSDEAMDKLMGQFQDFLKESENDEGMKQAMEEIVGEIISKDSLYQPMKTLQKEYPQWLEDNWEKVSQDDLERYNKQLDIINDICETYDKNEGASKEQIFEKLGKL